MELFTVKQFLIRVVIYFFIIAFLKSDLVALVFFIGLIDLFSTFFHVIARATNPPNKEGLNPVSEKSSVYQQESKKTQIEIDLEQRRMQEAYETQTKEDRQKTGLELALEKESFNISDKIVTFDQFGSHSSRATVGVAFDFDTLKICVYEVSNSDVKIVVFPVSQILSLEVIEDGQTVSHSTTTGGGEIKTSSGSMLGRAVVGGVLLGGVGAIIGGATARKTTTAETVTHTNTVENVNEIKLKMLVNNTTKPLISIPFLSNPTVRGSTAYTVACKNIEHCEALIKVLMMRASQAKVS